MPDETLKSTKPIASEHFRYNLEKIHPCSKILFDRNRSIFGNFQKYVDDKKLRNNDNPSTLRIFHHKIYCLRQFIDLRLILSNSVAQQKVQKV